MRPIAQLRLHLSLRRDRSADDADMKACRVEALPGYQALFPGQPELNLSRLER
jgi:hypothetical protein